MLIGTPGRLADLLQREDFGLSHSIKSLVSNFHIHQFVHVCVQELLILDEADRLLELGFQEKYSVVVLAIS